MAKSKRKEYINSLEDKKYNVSDAMEFIQASPKVKFNESIDVAINLGCLLYTSDAADDP